MSRKLKVFTLMTCRSPDSYFGAAGCFFKTIRTGFPSAELYVYDNQGVTFATKLIEDGCRFVDATYHWQRRTTHHEWIKDILKQEKGEVIFIDPDVVFWENCETYEPTENLAGRYIPKYYNEVVQAIEFDRLHTSFLWIKNVEDLLLAINKCYPIATERYPLNVIDPFVFKVHGKNYFYDTCASLYHTTRGEAFVTSMLNRYDHLFCGSMLDLVSPRLSIADNLRQVHSMAEANLASIRGIWKEQEQYFKAHVFDT